MKSCVISLCCIVLVSTEEPTPTTPAIPYGTEPPYGGGVLPYGPPQHGYGLPPKPGFWPMPPYWMWYGYKPYGGGDKYGPGPQPPYGGEIPPYGGQIPPYGGQIQPY